MLYLSLLTSFFASICLTIMLKVLEYFKLIDWSPVGYTKKLNILEESEVATQWMLLWLTIFIVAFILYIVMQFVIHVPHFLTSLVIGSLISLVIEWIIFDLPAELSSFKKLSIPFMIVVIITCRFIFETASYHYKANQSENKLPYNNSMIK